MNLFFSMFDYPTSGESSRTMTRNSGKRVQFNENSEVFTSFDSDEAGNENDFDLKKRRKSSAEKVKGQIFDVAFKESSQELSAANLRDRMKVIIQASIEEDDEKIRYLVNTPKLAWTHLGGAEGNNNKEELENLDHIKADCTTKKLAKNGVGSKRRNVVAVAQMDTESQAVSTVDYLFSAHLLINATNRFLKTILVHFQ